MQMVSFPGRYENLPKIAELVRKTAQEAGLRDFELYAVETAVDEACSNIIEHAYGGEDQGEIVCCLDVIPEGLSIVLKDHGQPFDPESVPVPRLNCPIDERESHGLGLYIMRQWMDEVQFHFEDGVNTLTMIKRRGK